MLNKPYRLRLTSRRLPYIGLALLVSAKEPRPPWYQHREVDFRAHRCRVWLS